MALKARYPALLPPGFHAGQAEVLSIEGYVAQRAEKAAAVVAGNLGLLAGMIEAACLLAQDGLSGPPRIYAPQERRKGVDLKRAWHDEHSKKASVLKSETGRGFLQAVQTTGSMGFYVLITLVSQMRSCKALF